MQNFRHKKRVFAEYNTLFFSILRFVAKTGFEPVTFGLWIQRSNHLSYLAILVCGCKSTTFFDIYKIISDIFTNRNTNRLLLSNCIRFLCLLNFSLCLVIIRKKVVYLPCWIVIYLSFASYFWIIISFVINCKSISNKTNLSSQLGMWGEVLKVSELQSFRNLNYCLVPLVMGS